MLHIREKLIWLHFKNCIAIASSWHARCIFLQIKIMLHTAHSTHKTHQKLHYSCWQQQDSDWQIPTFERMLVLLQLSLVPPLTYFTVAPVRNTQRPHHLDAQTDSKLTFFFYVLMSEYGCCLSPAKVHNYWTKHLRKFWPACCLPLSY